MKTRQLVLALILVVASRADARQAGRVDTLAAYGNHMDEGNGRYVLRTDGDYIVDLPIYNDCEWEQTVEVTAGGQFFANLKVPAKSGLFSSATRHAVRIRNGQPRPDADLFRVEVRHRLTTSGEKTCEENSDRKTFAIIWVTPDGYDDNYLPRKKARMLMIFSLKQTERRTETSTPTTPTTLVSPAPTAWTLDRPSDLLDPETSTPTPTTPPPNTTTAVSETGCSESTDCLPLDACTDGSCGGAPSWTGKLTDGLDSAFQEIGAETIRVRIEMTRQQAAVPARRDLNPLGLLSRSISEFVDWWMPTVYAAEQSLQKGLQFLITSQGGSTGKNLAMQVLNFTGKPVNLEGMLALEPLKKDAQQKVTQAFSKLAGRQLPSTVDLNAYCLEFLKLPPMAGQVMRVAGPEVQKRFAPMKRIMAAANKLSAGGALKPDTNPASYGDSVKQWAIWTVEQKFTDKKFADAFLGHTKKNVEAAGQKWTTQIEDAVRQRTPNRWQDIVQILKTAGAPVPQ